MSQFTSARYHSYPLCLTVNNLDAHDLAKARSVLEEKSDELFVPAFLECRLELREGVVDQADQATSSTAPRGRFSVPSNLDTEDRLFQLLEKPIPARSNRIIVVYRTNSWSRMKITQQLFSVICGYYELHPSLVSFIEGLGLRYEPNDEHFTTVYRHISTQTDDGQQMREVASDVCYNLRHFEKHQRDLANPWSCRQVVVHHKLHFVDRASFWLVVQPPQGWNANLDDARSDITTHPMALHVRLLWLVLKSYREYLNYLSKQVTALDQRVCFSKPLMEFDFDFKLNQKVQSLRKSLHHSKMVLDGMSQIVHGLSSHAEAIRLPSKVPRLAHDDFLRELSCMTHHLTNYQSTTAELLGSSNDIKSTIHCIVELRNQELLRANVMQLQRLAEVDAKETQYMAQLSERMHHDSRTMRVATLIAMIYLPANVVLAFFSTIFVEFAPASDTESGQSGAGTLQLHPQVWIAVLITLAFVLCTWGMFSFYNHRKDAARGVGATA